MTISLGVLASVSSRTFECLAKSGTIPAADLAAARALRAGHTVKRHHDDLGSVDIRKSQPKEAKVQFETPVEKVERSRSMQSTLQDTIAAYARRHGCSLAKAADMVLLSPTTSEYHRLEKQMREVERDVRMDKFEGAWVNTNEAAMQRPSSTPPVARPSEEPKVESADAILQRLADAQMQRSPAMGRAQAVTIAANSPEFTAAHRAEKERKGL
jgi:hypothetical protein